MLVILQWVDVGIIKVEFLAKANTFFLVRRLVSYAYVEKMAESNHVKTFCAHPHKIVRVASSRVRLAVSSFAWMLQAIPLLTNVLQMWAYD